MTIREVHDRHETWGSQFSPVPLQHLTLRLDEAKSALGRSQRERARVAR